MNQCVELTPEPFYEFADDCQRLVYGPAVGNISQDSASFELQIRNVNELEKSGKLQSWVAEGWRFRIRESAKAGVYNRVAVHRVTKDKLAQVRAVARRAPFDHELEIPDIDEERIRLETLRELNDLWRETIMWHQAAL